MEDDQHYHKQPPQDGHIVPCLLARVQSGKGGGHGNSGGQTGTTAGKNMPQDTVSGISECEEVLQLLV